MSQALIAKEWDTETWNENSWLDPYETDHFKVQSQAF